VAIKQTPKNPVERFSMKIHQHVNNVVFPDRPQFHHISQFYGDLYSSLRCEDAVS